MDAGPRIDASEAGATLWLRVQPRARRSAVVGLLGEELKVAVKAPPVDGAANEAVVAFVAELAGVHRRDVRIVSGQCSRSKRVAVDGVDEAALRRRVLDALAAA